MQIILNSNLRVIQQMTYKKLQGKNEMTIIRMLSPEALIRLVIGEDAHREQAIRITVRETPALFIFPNDQIRGKSTRTGCRHV